nr:mannose-6-phosphate isomerase, class I [Micromonospora sp. DSM 115978]
MRSLRGVVRDYAWGSRTVIAALQGRPVPSPGPEAELWLGAHPDSPALLDPDGAGTAYSLLDALTAEPDRWLSAPVAARFGRRLPYLLKVLAAEAPLSLQAHPDQEQARLGHAAERSVPPGGHRNYADPYHKPEMLVALSSFEALCGFRDPLVSAAAIDAFGLAALAPVTAALRTGAGGLRTAVRELLTWPAADRAGLVTAVTAAPVAPGHEADARLARELADRYPGDPGVLVALLLNHVRLAPGEAIWMPAGNLHAYLRGAGVEVMAASDNVLRGGLTPKHVDVPELLRVLRFEVLDDPLLPATAVAPGVTTWPVPIDDFVLHRVELAGPVSVVELSLTGPRLVLCVTGGVRVSDGSGAVELAAGGAAIGPADGGPVQLSGLGEAYVASVGTSEFSRSA